ncbi:kelch repeat-containing protein [Patulibacter defluvii]|uniref:kelch repeat-containing protein n=1 Tax=Patulibacter defluvii TaxID=3095358 RepID=UPI002A75F9F9|nr:kelch repeat-containing protein [Patulibacter sp. DM4]
MHGRWRRGTLVASAACGALLAPAAVASAASGWAATGSMADARGGAQAALLRDGRVLVVSGFDGQREVAGAELYDPASERWQSAAPPLVPRHYATATLLLDGRVLVTGGRTPAGTIATSELYDPRANTWTATGSLNQPREGHSAVRLADGRVLVAGGSAGRVGQRSAEIYDPATGTWTTTASLAVPRENAAAALLASGQVLVAGGSDPSPFSVAASSERYDPATGTWSPSGSMAAARAQAGSALLSDGRVVVAGGIEGLTHGTGIERYDPATGSWTPQGQLPAGGNLVQAEPLAAGRAILVVGERGASELYDAAAGGPIASFLLGEPRFFPTLTALPDGRVLIAGGGSTTSAARRASAELFTPPTVRQAADADLGAVAVGASGEHELTVTNAGPGPLRVTGLALTGADAGAFAIVADGCRGTSVAVAGRCTVRVRFAPTAAGERRAQLTFADNAEGSPPVALRATGTADAPTVPTTPTDPGMPPPVPCADRYVVLAAIEARPGRRPRVRLTGLAARALAGAAVAVERDGRSVGRTRVARDGAIVVTVPAPTAARARARARYRLTVAGGARSLAHKATRAATIEARRTRADGAVTIRGRIAGVHRATRLAIEGVAVCGGGRPTVTSVRSDRRGRFRVTLAAPRDGAAAVVYRVRQGRRTSTLPLVVPAR